MLIFPVDQMADIVPYAHRAIMEIRCALRIQKHHPASIHIRAEHLFQTRDAAAQFLSVFKMLPLYSVVKSCRQIPMGLKTTLQICLNLSYHFLQLVGTFLESQLHQGIAHKNYAQYQENE